MKKGGYVMRYGVGLVRNSTIFKIGHCNRYLAINGRAAKPLG